MKYLVLILMTNLYASNFNLIAKKKKKRKISRVKKEVVDLNALLKIQESKEKMRKLLSEMDSTPLVIEDARLRVGSIIKGRLLNSITTSQAGSPVIIEVLNSKLEGSRLLCSAKRVSKRANLTCSVLLTPSKDIQINAKILSLDGSLGLKGKYTSGKVGSSIIEGLKAFGRGVLGYSKTRVNSDRGAVIDQTIRNQSIEGVSGVLDSSADDYLKNQVDESESVQINSGKEVLIYFNKEVQY